MKIALIQTELSWENPNENKALLQEKINAISQYVDLIVLPEMFTSGFTMNPRNVAQTMQGDAISWLKETAKDKNCAITGSLVIEENGNYCNRLVFVFPNGEIQTYDKRHLFTLAGEDKVYTAGKDKLIVDYKGFKICPLICYDLRFPVFARNVEDYDVLIYVANWPKPRVNAWDILLKARAVENMSYVIGVNRIGFDENNHEYVGHSQAVDFLGNYIQEPQEIEGFFIVELDKNELIETREKLNFLTDRDEFQIK
ncbi:amidohydrolase [Flavobacterium aquatile]|uniref:Omega-amidase YafV n=1 Tax=Flavobacterium aquatile LMG 4008 = ATCC 11947 TaxID=1453498 RepID=A0A095TXT8_9FLAO|nr:amidohydrolase [Flavobacterium aquatile]KGD67158.1 amidohydrolase [Flavobacterium aquatile LMG 4008 = ATCC 11947]OXA66684.1 amidohydrolase [Flavobacterium aquatile] [Flavobacterium aquatile LMG 4008 = ATCC 11947]GEC78454.1 amidohydrolase [Flavobacterium aquatile]